MTAASPISPLPGKAPNKAYEMQGWNAKLAGHALSDNPYYATSTAANLWAKGFKS